MATKKSHRTPPRGKNGRFLTKAQIAARKRARHGGGGHHKPKHHGGHRAREGAATGASAAESRRSAAARKAARTRRENEESRRRASAKAARTRKAREEAEEAKRRRAKAARARDQLTTQRHKGLESHWRTGRYPAGHPRAGQFKSTRPGSGSVSDNPLLAAAENPLGIAEWLIGGGSLAFGAIVTGVLDRVWSTVGLTDSGSKDANGNEVYTDPGGTAGGPYAGMTNAAAYAAPMGVKRWLLAGAAVVTPIVAGSALAYFTHDGWPKTTAFLNFWGLGGFAYVVIKGATDLGARLLRGTAFGQRVFDVEIRAQALKTGSSYTGPTPPSTGLGKSLAGCGDNCGCGPCKARKNSAQPEVPPPPAFGPPAQVPTAPGAPPGNPVTPANPTPPANYSPANPYMPATPGSSPDAPAQPVRPYTPGYGNNRVPMGPGGSGARMMAGIPSRFPIGIMSWGDQSHQMH